MGFKEFYLGEMSRFTPDVRGGWNKAKILRYLKNMRSGKGDSLFWKTMDSYSSFEEFKNNLYWHGTTSYVDGLKPSIVFGKKWVDSNNGGGGYGIQYWVISVSRSKKIASNFSGDKDYVYIYPVLIKKDAKIVDISELPSLASGEKISDSEQLEEHIEYLWNNGIDAVWLGGGEEELCIVNPTCSVIGQFDGYKVFGIKVNDPTDEELLNIWNSRHNKLTDVDEQRKKKIEANKIEKEKKQKNYEEASKKFYSNLEDYKQGKINTYTMDRVLHELEMASIPAIQMVDALKKKREYHAIRKPY